MHTDEDIAALLCRLTGASRAWRVRRLQRLWSGWGEIVRFGLQGADAPSVIVKSVQPPARPAHPLGWQGDRSAARKRRSYVVEETFYRDFAPQSPARLPAALHVAPGLFVLEDLDAAGFDGRAVGAGSLKGERSLACLDWLADFHAAFLGRSPEGLWPVGTYWHLQTRPDELAAMPPGPLRDAAGAIDARLSAARFQTLVHGDAKVANFCFGRRGGAAVDFQYVGGGCGVKDVAYFLGSILGDAGLERLADGLVDRYLDRLVRRLPDGIDGAALEAEWRALLPLAWADFERFLAGWSPGHWKRSGYAARQVERALASL